MEDLRSPEGPEAKTPAPPDQPGEDNPTIIYRIEKILPEALKALIPGGAEPSAEKPQNPEVKTITSSPASAEPVADEKEPEKPAGPKVILVKQPDAPAEPETPAAEEPAAQKQLSNREVTDHTAGLWNYLPIPENEPEPAPEYLKCNLAYPGAHVIGARVRGKKHKHEGSNCDDWFEAAAYGDATFLAVSDGAGSKKFSRIGAKESCKAATGFLREGYAELLSADPELPEKLKLEISDERCMTACRQIAELVQKAVIQAWKAVESAFIPGLRIPLSRLCSEESCCFRI